jgi:hypothetical protein
MPKTYGTYVAILDRDRATALCRAGLRRLALDTEAVVRPQGGDRVALLSVRGPLFVSDAAFVGTADVLGDDGAALRLRHRVLAPPAYTVPLRTLPSLRVSAGWTRARLGVLRGGMVRCTIRDAERIEAALLAVARAHGPRARRPAHRRPRTPGRRALIAGRAAVGPRP